MSLSTQRTTYLLQAWAGRKASPEEERELVDWLKQQEHYSSISGYVASLEKHYRENNINELVPAVDWERLFNKIVLSRQEEGLPKSMGQLEDPLPVSIAQSGAHRVHFLKTAWFRYAAAVILLVGGAALMRTLTQRHSLAPGTAVVEELQNIAGETNRALLTVGNKTISLNSNKTGIAVGRTITYNDGEKIAEAGQMLQLTTPRGGQYQAILPDGSKVWLNAASSIKFPPAFKGSAREVEITGEAYLEITKNAKQSFYVHTAKTTVQVLGTSFNVHAYDDEAAEKTTLIEGSVRIIPLDKGGSRAAGFDATGAILHPGQQATIINNQLSIFNNRAESAIAWRNGIFNFQDVDFEQAMKQLERWYDIQIKYEGEVPAIRLKGEMDRGVQLSDVLKVLTMHGINSRLENRTLIIAGLKKI